MTKLLIPEYPLQVLPSLACAIGLNEAIVLQQVHYWITKASAKNIRDGHLWVYKTLKDWRKEFPFWSLKTVQRTIERLEDCGLLVSSSTYNAESQDRTKWYRVDREMFELLEEQNLNWIDLVIMTKWAFGQLDQMQLDQLTKCKWSKSPNLFNKVVDPETTPETTPESTATRAPAHEAAAAVPLDFRLAYLISNHNLDIREHQLRQWCQEYGLEIVVEIARWYAHGRRIGKLRGAGWMTAALKDNYGCPPEGFDRSLYLTPDEQATPTNRDTAASYTGWDEDQDELPLPTSPEDEGSLELQPDPLPPFSPPHQPPISNSANTLWETSYAQLQLQMPREAFDTWLRGAKLLNGDSDFLILGVPNIYAREWLEHRLKKIITRTLSQIAGRSIEVQFVLWSEYEPVGEEQRAGELES